MNPEVALNYNFNRTFLITNYFWTLNSLNDIFFLYLSLSQVDLAIVSILSNTLAGMISSYFVIFDEKRDKTDNVLFYKL